ncbi:MAG: peptidoglycan DD-metalloendopeptidase family protein [bacterium]|nr:peptidoglycan DD-metalloendopeptidase family protein [bacterium]
MSLKLKIFLLFTSISYSLFIIPALGANTPEDLKSAIEAKNKALQDINQQIQQTQKDLDAAQGQGKTLQNQIKQIDYQLNQVNLGIRSSELTIDKLNLEINSLQGGIKETSASIKTQKSGIAVILDEINKKDNETILVTLLKNKNLSDSWSELQNLNTLNVGLSVGVDKYQELSNKLTGNLNSTAQKRKGIVSENQNLKTKKSLAVSEKNDRQTLLSQTKNQEKLYQNLITDLEKQQNSISDEIDKIEDQLRSTFDPTLLPIKRPGVFSWPIKLAKDGGTAYITQRFGEKSYLYKGKPHNGLDIGSPIGTPVFAAADGKVIAVDNNDKSSWAKYQYGKYILIQHDNNLVTLYGHLSVQAVQKNSIVKRGDLIGYEGRTGYATGPHLHFGVYWAPSVLMKSLPPAAGLVPIGVVINPEDYL